jgi:hypothetical protein
VDFADRRRAERFIGAIPIELKQGRGLTRDFSTDGVYFETDQPLSVGEELDFTMHLDNTDSIKPLRVHCRGKVLRVETFAEQTGAAIVICSHVFEHAAI